MNKKQKMAVATSLSLLLMGNVFAKPNQQDIKIKINGNDVISDVAPFVDNNRTLVPIRVISENLGYNVNWDNQTQKVTVKNDNKVVELTIGKKDVHINGNNSSIDVAPMIKNNRTFVPLRFISESFGNDVKWDNDSRIVIINKKEIKEVNTLYEDKNTDKVYYSIVTPPASQKMYHNEETMTLSKEENNKNTKPKTDVLDKKENNTPADSKKGKKSKQEEKDGMETRPATIEKNPINKDVDILTLGRTQNKEKDVCLDKIRSVCITIKNDTWMNFDLSKEESEYNHLKQEYESTFFDETPQEKIRQLDMIYKLETKKRGIQHYKEYCKTSSELYQKLYDTFIDMYGCTNDDEIKNYAKKCDEQAKAFDIWRNDKVINHVLYDYLKEREYITKKIDLLYLDGSDKNKDDIFELNQKLVQIDSFIMYTRKPDTDFTMYPHTKQLLDEYDNNIKRDVENYHTPQ